MNRSDDWVFTPDDSFADPDEPENANRSFVDEQREAEGREALGELWDDLNARADYFSGFGEPF